MFKSKAFRIAVGATSLAAIASVLTVLYFVNPSKGHGLIPCPLYVFTNFYCSGCGAARATHSLLHFEFYRAFRYNPAMVILIVPIAFYVLFGIFDFMKIGKNSLNEILPQKLLIIIIILLMVFGILRNIPIVPFSWLAPTVV